MTSASATLARRTFSPMVLPLTVSASAWMRLALSNSFMTAGRPPAR
jgi:hypothetical protein